MEEVARGEPAAESDSVQPERALILDDILFPDWPEPVPEEKNRCDDQANSQADQKKPAVRRIGNEQNHDYTRGNH